MHKMICSNVYKNYIYYCNYCYYLHNVGLVNCSDLLPAMLDGVVKRKTCDFSGVLSGDDLKGFNHSRNALLWRKKKE